MAMWFVVFSLLIQEVLSATEIPLTWETAQEWRTLTTSLAKDAYSNVYWSVPAATTLSTKGSVVGIRIHFESKQNIRLYFNDNFPGNDLIKDNDDTVGRAVIKHVDGSSGSKYVEMYFTEMTCFGDDGGPQPTGCYLIDSFGMISSIDDQYVAKLANDDSYTCTCGDCNYYASGRMLSLLRSRYVTSGNGDSWFSTIQCTGSQLLDLPAASPAKNERTDGYGMSMNQKMTFRANCRNDGGCDQDAGSFRVEPIYESCKTGFFMSQNDGCYPAEITDATGSADVSGGTTITFIGINFGQTKPDNFKVKIEGRVCDGTWCDATWVSNSRVNVVLPPWPVVDALQNIQACGWCSIVLVLGENEASTKFSYEISSILVP